MRPRRRPLLLLSLVLLLACSCGGSDDGDSAESTAAASTAVTAIPDKTIVIDNFDFAPETLQVRVGDTVTVDNRDASEHTVTATDKSFDTGTLATGKTTFTVTKAGRFEYVCEIHPFMPRRVIQVSA
ncbi:MAG TPA: cupredoxin domain-containing protein [Acidimicrobiales bacterium]|nr:cupredoxin domain-containing protein [Acidimicrobiales bacterium]